MATLLYIITEGIKGGPFELTDGTHILGSAEGATFSSPTRLSLPNMVSLMWEMDRLFIRI